MQAVDGILEALSDRLKTLKSEIDGLEVDNSPAGMERREAFKEAINNIGSEVHILIFSDKYNGHSVILERLLGINFHILHDGLELIARKLDDLH